MDGNRDFNVNIVDRFIVIFGGYRKWLGAADVN
jgi:hypothetical protein